MENFTEKVIKQNIRSIQAKKDELEKRKKQLDELTEKYYGEIDELESEIRDITQSMEKFSLPLPTTQAEARQYAIDWQNWASVQDLSYGEMAEMQSILLKIAEDFDLVDEFTENGII